LLKRGSPWDFAPKTQDTAQGYLKCVPPHIGDPVVWTDGRTDGHVTITSLPKFLVLIGYQVCLAMVLPWRATRTGSAISKGAHWIFHFIHSLLEGIFSSCIYAYGHSKLYTISKTQSFISKGQWLQIFILKYE